MADFKLEIEFEEGDKETTKLKINDVEIDTSKFETKKPNKDPIEVIEIYEGSRCVWRNGRLYCA